MAKKIFGVYLAKLDAPNSEAHARLELPASPWELHDAVDKVQLQENEELYLEIDDYYSFEYLAPHLMELDASLNELNDLAGRLAVLDETEQEAFDGLLRLEIQRKVESNASIITMQDMRDLAASAGADCCHVVDATSDTELGRFYAENGFMEELDGLSDDVFEMLDFGKIGKALRTGENGTFTRNGYVVQHSELITAPLCAKELPPKPEYLFRLTLGLHPDLEDDRTVTLELPTSAEALRKAQKQIGANGWEGVVVLDYDGIIPQAAEFADLPAELDAFNDFAESVKDMPSREKQLPKLKALSCKMSATQKTHFSRKGIQQTRSHGKRNATEENERCTSSPAAMRPLFRRRCLTKLSSCGKHERQNQHHFTTLFQGRYAVLVERAFGRRKSIKNGIGAAAIMKRDTNVRLPGYDRLLSTQCAPNAGLLADVRRYARVAWRSASLELDTERCDHGSRADRRGTPLVHPEGCCTESIQVGASANDHGFCTFGKCSRRKGRCVV